MGTIFSKIISGKIPSFKIAEDENFYAFLDINPIQKGHTLVVSKIEEDYIFDLDDELLCKMMIFSKRVAANIKEKLNCKKVAVMVIGLEVSHAHIHLIPINNESDLNLKSRVEMNNQQLAEIADSIKL